MFIFTCNYLKLALVYLPETRYTNALATRLVVRSLLPRNHGGVDAENVIVIDADNSSSPYLYVDIGRQYGMHNRNLLHKVLVTDNTRYIN